MYNTDVQTQAWLWTHHQSWPIISIPKKISRLSFKIFWYLKRKKICCCVLLTILLDLWKINKPTASRALQHTWKGALAVIPHIHPENTGVVCCWKDSRLGRVSPTQHGLVVFPLPSQTRVRARGHWRTKWDEKSAMTFISATSLDSVLGKLLNVSLWLPLHM